MPMYDLLCKLFGRDADEDQYGQYVWHNVRPKRVAIAIKVLGNRGVWSIGRSVGF